MSTDVLRLIPANPSFVPEADAIANARAFLRQLFPDGELIVSDTSNDIRFIDQGENFESVSCPRCGRELAVEWWQEAMDRAYDGCFADLTVTLPCCGGSSSLNALNYHGPAGFARFSLEVVEPGSGGNLTPDQMKALERLLSAELRQIRARY